MTSSLGPAVPDDAKAVIDEPSHARQEMLAAYGECHRASLLLWQIDGHVLYLGGSPSDQQWRLPAAAHAV